MHQSSRVRGWQRTWSAVALLLLSAAPIFAATITATSTGDSGPGSLRAAIASAANGDTINFSLTYPATIVLSTPLTLGPSVTIAGPGASDLAISGGNSVVVLIVNAGATAAISGLSIENGSSLLGGGIFNGGTLTLTNCVVSNNTVGTQLGGGIFNAGTLTLANTYVSQNAVDPPGELGLGGGIYNYLGTLTLVESTVISNSAGLNCCAIPSAQGGSGGGIYNDNGTLILTNSTIENNLAATSGGGISNIGPNIIFGPDSSALASGPAGTLSLTASTVYNNFCTPSLNGYSGPGDCTGGGGIYNRFGIVSLTNSTVANNASNSISSPIGGGGILNEAGTLSLSFSTLSGNDAYLFGASSLVPSAGGGISDFQGTLTVKNSILANSTGGNCSVTAPATANSDGYNLSDDATCAGFLTQTGDLNSTAAGLDPAGLQNNGGPTETIALLPSSPAVNAIPVSACTDVNGNPVTTDQRGVPRPQGSGCDIGAFEYLQSANVVPAVQTFLLIGAVQASTVPRIVQVVLTVPLQAAVDSMNQGHVQVAVGQLEAFVILVDLDRLAGGLSQQQAAAWTSSAKEIIQSLGS